MHFDSLSENIKKVNSVVSIDTIGIPITENHFNLLVDSLLNKFKIDGSEDSIVDYLNLIKVINTIRFNFLESKKSSYNELINIFYKYYFDKTIKITDAEVSIGLGYYSKQYDIYIGGKKNNNSMFKILN
jgi:hypothetical protein